MNTEQTNLSYQLLAARLKVVEEDLATLKQILGDKFPTTPKGTSGTMTGDEHSHGDEIEGWITPNTSYGANIREWASTAKSNPPLYRLEYGKSIRISGSADDMEGNINPATGKPFVWYMVLDGDDNFVREDVVTFTPDKPVPATPINAALWPAPISSYSVTNTHHNHRDHHGIDLAARIGTPIFSGPNEGYVMKAFRCIPCGDDPTKQMHSGTSEASYGYGLGNYVVARYYQHPAENKGHFLFVLYAHLSRINVQEKAALPPYTVIGEVGTSGNSTGPHLHIECRYSDNPLAEFYSIRANEIDPSTIFKA